MPRNSCIYHQAVTTTYRLASRGITVNFESKKVLGTNLQNLPHEMRNMYIPDEGYIFVQVDQSGAEALIVAYLCRHGLFRDLFLNNIKPHVFVAMHVFQHQLQEKLNDRGLDIKIDIEELIHCPIKDLQRHPFFKIVEKLIKDSDGWRAEERYYYIGKMLCHGANYGIRPFRFSMEVLKKSKGKIVITEAQAKVYLSLYHSLFPEIREWHRQVEWQVSETGILYNLFGFPREFNSLFEQENDFKEAYAFPAQSTVGIISNIAVARHQELIEDTGLDHDILANTHDSYLTQCRIGEEVECAKIMRGFLNQELTAPSGEKFRMKSEAKCGFNWGDYDKYNPEKNPLGLKEMELN